jgi:hypothetical protein
MRLARNESLLKDQSSSQHSLGSCSVHRRLGDMESLWAVERNVFLNAIINRIRKIEKSDY